MQQAPAGDVELVALQLVGPDAQRDVRLQLLHKAFAKLPARNIRPFLTGKRRVVDAEDHLQGWLVDLNWGQGNRVLKVGYGVADVNFVTADDSTNITGTNLVGFGSAQSVEDVDAELVSERDTSR